MSSAINKPVCGCGGGLQRVCPSCYKEGDRIVDEEQLFNCPVGWIKVDNELCDLPPDCPPYFVCSEECLESFLALQNLLASYRRGDPDVIMELREENGKRIATIYRRESK